jgi:hypothetical protein
MDNQTKKPMTEKEYDEMILKDHETEQKKEKELELIQD